MLHDLAPSRPGHHLAPHGGRPPGHRRPRRLAVVAAALLLVVGAAACSDDDAGAGDPGVTEPGGDTTTEPGGEDPPPVEDPGSGRPFNESDLVDALLDPAALDEGLEVDPAVGEGAFQPELCLGEAVEVTWDDQAGQGLLRAGGDDPTLVVTQSVLEHADADAADAFVDDVIDVATACSPELAVEDVDGLDGADRAVRLGAGVEGGVAALVRSGSHVTYLAAQGDPAVDLEAVLDDDALAGAAALLPG